MRNKRVKSQASIEYLILAAVITLLLIVWLEGAFPTLRDNLKTNFFDRAVDKILNP